MHQNSATHLYFQVGPVCASFKYASMSRSCRQRDLIQTKTFGTAFIGSTLLKFFTSQFLKIARLFIKATLLYMSVSRFIGRTTTLLCLHREMDVANVLQEKLLCMSFFNISWQLKKLQPEQRGRQPLWERSDQATLNFKFF